MGDWTMAMKRQRWKGKPTDRIAFRDEDGTLYCFVDGERVAKREKSPVVDRWVALVPGWSVEKRYKSYDGTGAFTCRHDLARKWLAIYPLTSW
jgi:hypothetical protein